MVNGALYLVTVNGRDAPKKKIWAETENSGCAWSKTKTENAFVIIIYLMKYYEVIVLDF